MACGSLRTNKTFQMCGCVTLGCLPIFQLGQQSPLVEKRRAFSSPAKADKAQGAHGLSLQAVSVWVGRLFVCSASERLIIPLAPVTHPALCHQQLPGHIRDRWGECSTAEQSSMYRFRHYGSRFLELLKILFLGATSKFPLRNIYIYKIRLRY